MRSPHTLQIALYAAAIGGPTAPFLASLVFLRIPREDKYLCIKIQPLFYTHSAFFGCLLYGLLPTRQP